MQQIMCLFLIFNHLLFIIISWKDLNLNFSFNLLIMS
jgi:hypothetical protein